MSHPPKIYIGGHIGMFGPAIMQQSRAQGHMAGCVLTRTQRRIEHNGFNLSASVK